MLKQISEKLNTFTCDVGNVKTRTEILERHERP